VWFTHFVNGGSGVGGLGAGGGVGGVGAGGGVGVANTHLQGATLPGQGQFASHQDAGATPGLLEVHVQLFNADACGGSIWAGISSDTTQAISTAEHSL
jgi:hypothetical protein